MQERGILPALSSSYPELRLKYRDQHLIADKRKEVDVAATRMKIAQLDDSSLAKLRVLEEEMGTLILALEPHHPLAKLDEEQVKRLQDLEQELGVVLVAYKPQ
jgi:DNA-binding transcriptional LysR family regulator